MIGSWIPEQNLRAFLETVAQLAGSGLDDDDWTAIEYALFTAKVPARRHASTISYPLGLTRTLTVELEYQRGTSDVGFQLDADPELEAQVYAVVQVMQEYEVRRRMPR
jgi:hypothetical protein